MLRQIMLFILNECATRVEAWQQASVLRFFVLLEWDLVRGLRTNVISKYE